MANQTTLRPFARLHRDERGSITGLILKVVLAVAVAGLALNEGGQILQAQVKAQSAARAAALEAARIYSVSGSMERAKVKATEAAAEADPDAVITDIRHEDDGSATVTVVDKARTLVTHRISFLKGFTVQRATEHQEYSR
jgi:hypothetical protein